MNFIRKKGFQLKTPPQIVGEVCLELEKEGRLTAKNLVDVSRDEDAPLHNEFEWSDDIAAEKYREVQAGYIIRSVEIEISSASPTITRMEVALSNAGEQGVRYFHATGEHGFDSLETISKDDENITSSWLCVSKISEHLGKNTSYCNLLCRNCSEPLMMR